jgi:ankyrin repeat protein
MDDSYRLITAFFSSLDDGLRLLRSEPALMEAKTGLGETPLHYLAVENQLEAVRSLVEHGADVDTINECGGTPLSEAALLGYETWSDICCPQGHGGKLPVRTNQYLMKL